MDRPSRLLVTLLVVLGLLLPKATAALASVGLYGQAIVICSGDGMTTITLDAQGRPVSSTAPKEPCGLLAPVAMPCSPLLGWTPAERRLTSALAPLAEARPPVPTGVPPPRGPPFA